VRPIGLNWKTKARMRRTEADWAEIVLDQRTSGATIKAFCEERGLPVSSFWYWKRRLSVPVNASKKSVPSKFLALPIAARRDEFEVTVGDMTVRFGGGAAERIVDAIITRIVGMA
jgi:transposase-like protein